MLDCVLRTKREEKFCFHLQRTPEISWGKVVTYSYPINAHLFSYRNLKPSTKPCKYWPNSESCSLQTIVVWARGFDNAHKTKYFQLFAAHDRLLMSSGPTVAQSSFSVFFLPDFLCLCRAQEHSRPPSTGSLRKRPDGLRHNLKQTTVNQMQSTFPTTTS